jgi:L-ascorbate metabolism protein UlaG (beta-lactamase superfamily)
MTKLPIQGRPHQTMMDSWLAVATAKLLKFRIGIVPNRSET